MRVPEDTKFDSDFRPLKKFQNVKYKKNNLNQNFYKHY